MQRLKFGAFLAPHHPIGENPMLQFRRDLDLVEQLDGLGYDEFWCGEHHSSGWEMIASPEMFLAAAGERSKRIKLGTGVISLPYHHPYNVAQRMVQLDHMTGGRAIFGSGPGALASDAHTLGIDPMLQRDRQDHAIGIIRRLFKGERVTDKTDWYTMQDAALQLLPLQEDMPFVVASSAVHPKTFPLMAIGNTDSSEWPTGLGRAARGPTIAAVSPVVVSVSSSRVIPGSPVQVQVMCPDARWR